MQKSIFRNFLYKSVLNIFNIVVPLLLGAYAIKTLGNNMGKCQYGDSIYQLFYIFAAFGIYNYGLREISRLRNDKEQLKQLFSSLFIIGIIANIIVLIIFIYFSISNFKGTDQGLIFYIYNFTLFSNIFYVDWVNEALEKYDFITIKSIIIRLIYIFLLLNFVKTKEDFILYTVLNSLQFFLNNVISFIVIKKEIGFTINGLAFKKHIKFLVIAMLMGSASYLYTGLDKALIGKYLGTEYILSYSTPQGIINMVFSLIISIVFVTVPRLSYALGNDDERMYEEILKKVIKSMSLFIFPAVIGVYVLHKEIIMIYTSGTVPKAIPVMAIFSLYMLSLGFEAIVTQQILYVKRKEKIIICFITLCGTINIFLKVILISIGKFSPVTASLTTCIVNFILVALEYTYSKKILKVNIKYFKFDNLKYFLIAIVFLPISMVVRKFTQEDITFSIITIFASCLYYLSMLFIIRDDIILLLLKKIKFN